MQFLCVLTQLGAAAAALREQVEYEVKCSLLNTRQFLLFFFFLFFFLFFYFLFLFFSIFIKQSSKTTKDKTKTTK